MRNINLGFTYLLTYLVTNRASVLGVGGCITKDTASWLYYLWYHVARV